MSFDIAEFEEALAQDTPPAGLEPPLLALWYGLKGAWSEAHAIVQAAEGDPSCAWVHAWLHRMEGDLANAAYWYRRAGRSTPTGSVASEGRTIAAELLARRPGGAATV